MIDTGATLSIVSSKAWDIVKQTCSNELEAFTMQIFTASGSQVDVKGKTQVVIELSGIKSVYEVIVADIDMDAILGLDFLMTNKCKLDIENKVLEIKGKKCKLNLAGRLGCYRVTVSQKIEIPPRSEMIIEGKVSVPVLRQNDLGLIEAVEKPIGAGNSLVAKALVYAKDKIPLRIINLDDEKQEIHPKTHVANLSFVDKIHPVKDKSDISSCPEQVPSHVKDLYERAVQGLSSDQCKAVAKLLTRHSTSFSESDSDLGRTGIIKHKIPTGNARPIKQPVRRLPMHMNEEINAQIDDMLQRNVIQPSSSPWASGIVMVQKKDGSKRFCVDYRKLNDVTTKDAYPLPRIDDSLDQLARAKWFSCLDLNSGYWQVEVDDVDREKTAFVSRQGLFEFRVMPFGLCNAPATFERLMETILAGLNWQICLIYLDDIIVMGKTFHDMLDNLDKVLNKIESANLKLKPRKCQLFAKKVEFLGHIISEEGIKTDPKKTQVVTDWPKPVNVHQVRAFLGFCSYYRRFIVNFAETAKPLHCLTEKGKQFIWSSECDDAFEKLKKKMIEAPVLAHPDFSEPFILDTDASDLAIGAVLSQKIDGQERPVAFASRTLTKAERRYCVTRKELLALVHFVKYFRHYLYGKTFTARTDHGSLRWLTNFKNPEGQIARWLETLSSYMMKIEHRPGRLHGNADGMSRVPYPKDSESGHRSTVNPVSVREDVEMGDIKNIQDSDSDVALVKSWVQSGKRPDYKEVLSGGYFVKSLWSQWPRLHIKDNILVRIWEVLGTDILYWQAVVPLSHRRVVLKYSHDIKASGHLGVT
ncbi:MAG: hypothetical protein JAY66_03025, partial [Candidatus Thiodiazotropha taylori]|nr:hypothetical protein [Candidatus Thiodiazotropha taylori]